MPLQERLSKAPYAVTTVMGMRGCGKTWLAAGLDYPVEKILYLDPVGALAKYLDERPSGQVAVLKLDKLPDQRAFVQLLARIPQLPHKSIVLDVSLLPRDQNVIITDLVSNWLLYGKPEALKVALVIDEAGEVLDQSHAYHSSALESVLRIGRNRNVLFVTLITQRPQKVDKHALALSDHYVAFKFVHNLDLDAVKDILGYDSVAFKPVRERLVKQGRGQYLYTDGFEVEFVGASDAKAPPVAESVRKARKCFRIPEDDKVEIVRLRKQGRSVRSIARVLGYSQSATKNVLTQEAKKNAG
jgi:hypothetical protein